MTEEGCGETPGALCFGVEVPTRGPAAAGAWGLGAPKFAVTPQPAALTRGGWRGRGNPLWGGLGYFESVSGEGGWGASWGFMFGVHAQGAHVGYVLSVGA